MIRHRVNAYSAAVFAFAAGAAFIRMFGAIQAGEAGAAAWLAIMFMGLATASAFCVLRVP